jgi:hypothetical protein
MSCGEEKGGESVSQKQKQLRVLRSHRGMNMAHNLHDNTLRGTN